MPKHNAPSGQQGGLHFSPAISNCVKNALGNDSLSQLKDGVIDSDTAKQIAICKNAIREEDPQSQELKKQSTESRDEQPSFHSLPFQQLVPTPLPLQIPKMPQMPQQ